MIRKIGVNTFARIILLALATLIAILLSSCNTESRRLKRCRQCAIKETIIKTDSSWQVKYDSLLKIPVKGPVIIMQDNPCADLCDSLGRVKDYVKSATSETGIKGTIRGDKKTNTITIDCGSLDSLKLLLHNARTENFRLTSEKKTVEVPARCEKEHRTIWDHFREWWFWLTASAMVLFLLYLRFKSRLL